MELKVNCPACKKAYRLPAAAEGKTFACKQCGGKVKVAASSGAAPPAAAPPAAPHPAPPTPGPADQLPIGFDPNVSMSRRKKPLPIKPIAIGAGALVILIVGALVVPKLLPTGDDTPGEPNSTGGLALGGNADPRGLAGQRDRLNQIDRERERQRIEADRRARDAKTSTPSEPSEQEKAEQRARQRMLQREAGWKGFQKFEPEAALNFVMPAPQQGDADQWSAAPDPPAQGSTFTPAPGLDLVTRGGFNRAEMPSPYVVSFEHTYKQRQITRYAGPLVYDMRTGKQVWSVPKKISNDGKIGVTPDGKRLVALMSTADGTDGVYVINHRQPLNPSQFLLPPTRYNFNRHDRPLIYDNDKSAFLYQTGRNQWVLFALDLRNGKRLWQAQDTISAKERNYGWVGGVAVSPGGGYIAVPIGGPDAKTKIMLIETGQGKRVGQIGANLPEDIGSFSELGFSADGSKLFGNAGNKHYAVWDMNDGKMLCLSKGTGYDAAGTTNRSAASDLLDNDGRMLITEANERIIDTRTGMILGSLRDPNSYVQWGKNRGNQSFRRYLGGGNYLTYETKTIELDGIKAPRDLLYLQDPINLDRYHEMIRHIDAGGTPAEVGLPIHNTYYLSAQPNELNYNWPFLPPDVESKRPIDLRPGSATFAGETQTLRFDFPYEIKETNTRLIWTTTLAGPSEDGRLLFSAKDGKTWLIDMTGQADPKHLALPGWQQALSLSRDGTLGVFLTGRTRVDVIRLDDMAVLHTVRIRVENDESTKGEAVRHARLIGKDRLWFYASSGEGLIDLTTGKLLFRDRRHTAQFTADDRHMLVPHYKGVVVVDPRTAIGIAEFLHDDPLLNGNPSASISPDGKRIACIGRKHGAMVFYTFDTQTGEVATKAYLPTGTESDALLANMVQGWVDNDHVILSNQSSSYLTDANTGRVLWRYYTGLRQSKLGLREVRGGRIWKEDLIDERSKQSLFSHKVPHAQALTAIQNSGTAEPVQLLLKPGDDVKLDLTGLKHETELRRNIIKDLERQRVTVSDQGKLTFRVRMTSSSDSIPYRVRNTGENATLRITPELYTHEWVGPDGEILWSSKILAGSEYEKYFTFHKVEKVYYSDRGDPQEQYDEDLDRGRPFGAPYIPVSLTTPLDQQALGASSFWPEGLADAPINSDTVYKR